MKGDFSRDTFDPAKQYSRVLVQQGRVETDADQNEQANMFVHELRQLARELIGAHGGAGNGFQIVPLSERFSFGIAFGCYFVDGIRCENTRTGQYSRTTVTTNEDSLPYTLQPNLPGVQHLRPGVNLVYLDVWERGITYIQDPSLRDAALGGVDSTVRTKVIWQVRVVDGQQFEPEATQDAADEQAFNKMFPTSSACLDVRLQRDIVGRPKNDASYHGLENSLYRVEIHEGGLLKDSATFKWSRNNASFAFPVTKIEGKHVTIKSTRGISLTSGCWLEYEDDESVLRNERYSLCEVEHMFEDDILILGKEINLNLDTEHHNPLLRLWERGVQTTKGRTENLDEDNSWIELENGIQIRFSGNVALPGDYWLFPVRTTAPDVIEWPGEQKARSICHHRAPLALVNFDESGKVRGNISHYRRVIRQIPHDQR